MRKVPRGRGRAMSVDMAGTRNGVGSTVGGRNTRGATRDGLLRTSIQSPIFLGTMRLRSVGCSVQSRGGKCDCRPTLNGIAPPEPALAPCILPAIPRRALTVTPTWLTVRYCEQSVTPSTLPADFHSTMDTRLHLPLASSNRMHGDSMTCSVTCSSGVRLADLQRFVVVPTTMAQMCVAKHRVRRMWNRIVGTPTSPFP